MEFVNIMFVVWFLSDWLDLFFVTAGASSEDLRGFMFLVLLGSLKGRFQEVVGTRVYLLTRTQTNKKNAVKTKTAQVSLKSRGHGNVLNRLLNTPGTGFPSNWGVGAGGAASA